MTTIEEPRDGAGPYSIGSDHWPGLSKLVEEMGELNTVLGKLMATGGNTAYWGDRDLRQEMTDEIADVLAAIHFFVERNLADADMDIDARMESKLALFRRWHQEALK